MGTQEEIVEHLKEEGISATQATVSRDIKELGIVKRPLKDMTYVYELPRVQHSGKLAEIIFNPLNAWELFEPQACPRDSLSSQAASTRRF